MFLKNNLICKVAKFTRKNQLFILDKVLRKIYGPDKRQHDFIETIVLLDNKLFFNVNTSSYLEWYIFFYGIYEPGVIFFLKNFLKHGDVVLDVGANVGIHSLIMGNIVGNGGRVYAFEPHPKIFERLKNNLLLNKMYWIEAINSGLSDVQGETILFAFEGANQGTARLPLFPEEKVANSIQFKIKLNQIDRWIGLNQIKRLNLIKVDVEGHDLHVLEGAKNTISNFRPIIVFEHNSNFCLASENKVKFDNLVNFLKLNSYNIFVVKNKTLISLEKSYLVGNSNLAAIPVV